jgi:hypothetical protein
MLDFPKPLTVKDLQRFLGMVNFYRWFLPKITQTLASLTNLLKGKDLPKLLPWEEHHQGCPRSGGAVGAPTAGCAIALTLATDTLDIHMGGVLQHKVRGALAAVWVLFLQVVGDRGELLHFRPGAAGHPGGH